MERLSKLGDNDGKGDLDKHVQLINEWLNYYSAEKALKCKLFVLTLVGPSKLWFDSLPDGWIKS